MVGQFLVLDSHLMLAIVQMFLYEAAGFLIVSCDLPPEVGTRLCIVSCDLHDGQNHGGGRQHEMSLLYMYLLITSAYCTHVHVMIDNAFSNQ